MQFSFGKVLSSFFVPINFLLIIIMLQTCLCKMHGLSILPRKTPRLWRYAGFIRELDLAIVRHGGPQALSDDQMREACFLRGLNPLGCNKIELIDWLNQWLQISKNLESKTLSGFSNANH